MANEHVSRRSLIAGVGALALASVALPATAQAIELTPQAKRKAVVVCFSCTGTTAGAVRRIKKATGAKLVRV